MLLSPRRYAHDCPRNSWPCLITDEIATALQLESEYNRALEILPLKSVIAIKKFHKSVSDKLTEDGTFFCLKGVNDGLLLYRMLEEL